MKPFKLSDWSRNPELFLRELPAEWAGELRAAWPEVAAESRILASSDKTAFHCGGVVSRSLFPDMAPYASEALEYFRKNYWYIGFLYVNPDLRSEGLGSRWLESVRTEVPARGFWLVIEKIGLLKFYARHGFRVVRVIHNGPRREWLLEAGREDW